MLLKGTHKEKKLNSVQEFVRIKSYLSSNINEVIRPVLNFLFFFTIRFHKYKKHQKAPESTKKRQKAQKHNQFKIYQFKINRHKIFQFKIHQA